MSTTPGPQAIRIPERGLTFLELVLVAAILTVLLVMAVPIYRQYVVRTHRTQAVSELIAMAACQEQQRASAGAYNTSACPQSSTLSDYAVSYSPAASDAVQEFQITALPVGSQSHDACGSLTLDHTGRRFVSGADADRQTCWAGR